jgi:DNA polymerase-3 subunit alpha
VGGIVTCRPARSTPKKESRWPLSSWKTSRGSVEIIVFSDLYERRGEIFQEDSPLMVKGKVDLKEEEEPKIIAESAVLLPRATRQLLSKWVRRWS